MIRAVTFDVWGTLLDLSAARRLVVRALSASLGLDENAVRRAMSDVDREVRALRRSKHLGGREAVELSRSLLASRLGVDKDRLSIVIDEAIISSSPGELAFEDVSHVARLRSLGLRLAVVGNTLFWSSAATKSVLERALPGAFDFMAFADETNYSKPDVRAFLAALTMLGAEPDEAIHVGDRVDEDVGGALAAGMAAALIIRDRKGGPVAIRDLRVAVLTSLGELTWAIEELDHDH